MVIIKILVDFHEYLWPLSPYESS